MAVLQIGIASGPSNVRQNQLLLRYRSQQQTFIQGSNV